MILDPQNKPPGDTELVRADSDKSEDYESFIDEKTSNFEVLDLPTCESREHHLGF